jgi:ADP-heptose:LPS heptosyltransferase
MAQPTHILIFRFSALGDVAMTVPVIKLLLQQHASLHVTMVSAPFMQPMFENIERLTFYGADTKKDFKGLKGLWRLSRQIRSSFNYDAIADLHDVLRTKILRTFLGGKPLAVINKGREEKKELTRPVNKKLRPLKTTFQRYADVFEELGCPVKLDEEINLVDGVENRQSRPGETADRDDVKKGDSLPDESTQRDDVKRGHSLPGESRHKERFLIGIAPFARHQPKMYPLNKMKEVVQLLQEHPFINIELFGSKEEGEVLSQWEQEFPRVKSLAGKVSFADELKLISKLDLMVSMDSANMHLASLHHIPVVSIWGGTHPFLGFYGWQQPLENAIQEDLACRPSSVFGNKECPVHGAAGCMQGITPQIVHDRIMKLIKG